MLAKTGSAKRGIVSPDLLNERAKLDFDQKELEEFLMGGKEKNDAYKKFFKLLDEDPATRNHVEFYEMTPLEM